MVQVRVSQNDRIQGLQVEGKLLPVAFTQGLEPLEETAVDEDAFGTGLDEVLGAGHGSGGSEKGELHGRCALAV